VRGAVLWRRREARIGTPFLKTSLGLILGKVLSLGVGFLFWVLAARAAGVGDIGVAAGAVSLMMLATQVAIAGTGSAFILNRTRFERDLSRLLDNAVTLVVVGGTAASLLSLAVVVLVMDELRPVATDPGFAVLFVLMTVLGTLGILLDHVSVALERGEQVVVRNVAGGVLTASPLLVPPALGWRLGAEPLFALWVVGGAVSCAIAAWQLSRQLDGYRYRPRLTRPLVAVLLRTGLPNHALTLVERAPNLLLPVVVTEVLSPQANAFWYVAWMMSWAVLVVPISIGMTLLAQVSGAAASLRR
jgi:O-antigen/teichoic acid export membrane protein